MIQTGQRPKGTTREGQTTGRGRRYGTRVDEQRIQARDDAHARWIPDKGAHWASLVLVGLALGSSIRIVGLPTSLAVVGVCGPLGPLPYETDLRRLVWWISFAPRARASSAVIITCKHNDSVCQR